MKNQATTEQPIEYELVLCSTKSCEGIPDEGMEYCEECEKINAYWDRIDRRHDDKYDE